MSTTETVDQTVAAKEGECYGTWSSRHEACTSKCAVRARCRKDTLAAGKPAPQVPAKTEEEAFDSTLDDMDPLEFLRSGLKGKFDEEVVAKDAFDTYRYRDDGTPVAQVMVSKASKQVRIQTATDVVLLREGLRSVRQAHALLMHVLLA